MWESVPLCRSVHGFSGAFLVAMTAGSDRQLERSFGPRVERHRFAEPIPRIGGPECRDVDGPEDADETLGCQDSGIERPSSIAEAECLSIKDRGQIQSLLRLPLDEEASRPQQSVPPDREPPAASAW